MKAQISNQIFIFESDDEIRATLEQILFCQPNIEEDVKLFSFTDKQGKTLLDAIKAKHSHLIVLYDPHAENALSSEELERLPGSDILQKPVRLGALLDRIVFHQKKIRDKEIPSLLRIGPYELDWKTSSLIRKKPQKNRHLADQNTLKLTEKETEILKLLFMSDEKTLSKEELLREVWQYAQNVETHTLETHIYRLRQKIEEDAAQPKILLTSEKGYTLKA